MNASTVQEKKPVKLYCEICRKTFASKNSYDQHEKSKKHIQGLKKKQESANTTPETTPVESPRTEQSPDTVVEVIDASELTEESEKITKGYTEPFTPEEYEFEPCRCLFCRIESDSFDAYISSCFPLYP